MNLINNKGGKVSVNHYDTGGYIGEWNSDDGRLAVLHQKELVLNKDDTANFLDCINTIRDMSALNGFISEAITRSVANMVLELGKVKGGNGDFITNNSNFSSNAVNNFNITAEFPNANNIDDIRQAILSLPNIASQYVANNNK